jgi:hypothetical protein
MKTYELNLPYRVSIDQIESYMKKGISEFVGTNDLTAEDQSKRLRLCKQYYYYAFTCVNPSEFEYCKMSDDTIKRIGKLNLIMYLFNNGFISASLAKELSDHVDIIEDEFNSCILHNRAIEEEKNF